ncbi:hypothetical protein HZ326_23673 [Fusarium oxysporum f. sp. albedinis]|nr:hypothetical protein HZ326_23673 [Fusarium oxysporum f. sp. albedinis]
MTKKDQNLDETDREKNFVIADEYDPTQGESGDEAVNGFLYREVLCLARCAHHTLLCIALLRFRLSHRPQQSNNAILVSDCHP